MLIIKNNLASFFYRLLFFIPQSIIGIEKFNLNKSEIIQNVLIKTIAFARSLEYKKYINIILENGEDFLKNTNISSEFIEKAYMEYENTIKYGAKFIPIYSDKYPQILRNIPNPPIILTAIGNIDILNEKIIAIVGSRTASYNGLELAENFAKSLYENGYIIASGLAKGIDGRSHIGAIKGTIGVIGSGINIRYPAENNKLYDDILKNNSCIVTEFAFDTKPIPANFPQRNRIIAGVSLGTLVVEAGMQSGSLSTARLTMEYNREVFAIPGFALDPRYKGNNFLIKKNIAKLTESIEDIMDEIKDINITTKTKIQKNNEQKNIFNNLEIKSKKIFYNNKNDYEISDKNENFEIKTDKDLILSILSSDYLSIDEICKRSNISADIVSCIIVEFEMNNVVISNGLGSYCKIF